MELNISVSKKFPNNKIKKPDVKEKEHPKVKEPYPQHPFLMIVNGLPKSGKTTILYNLLKNIYKKYFKNIYVFSPNVKLDKKYQGMKLDSNKTFTEFSDSTLLSILPELDEEGNIIKPPKNPKFLYKIFGIKPPPEEKSIRMDPDNHRSLIIFDDMANDANIKRSRIFAKKMVSHRHFNLSVILISQLMTGIPRGIRDLSSHCIMFKTENEHERDYIYDTCSKGFTRKEFNELLNYMFKENFKQYDFLFINMRDNKYYRKFEEELDFSNNKVINELDKLLI